MYNEGKVIENTARALDEYMRKEFADGDYEIIFSDDGSRDESRRIVETLALPGVRVIGGEQNLIFPLSRFIEKLKTKYTWHKPHAEGVVFVDGYNTSKTCHNCGFVNANLEVKSRNWICPECGALRPRDVNAANVIFHSSCETVA